MSNIDKRPLRDKLSPYDTEEMLDAMRCFLEEQGGEQK